MAKVTEEKWKGTSEGKEDGGNERKHTQRQSNREIEEQLIQFTFIHLVSIH